MSKDDERRKYDAARMGGGPFNFNGFSQNGPFSDFFHSSGSAGSGDFFEEILRSFGGFGSTGRRSSHSSSGFDSFFNRRPGPGASTATLKVPLKTALSGGQIQVSGLPGGTQTITVPAGSANGSILRVSTLQGRQSI